MITSTGHAPETSAAPGRLVRRAARFAAAVTLVTGLPLAWLLGPVSGITALVLGLAFLVVDRRAAAGDASGAGRRFVWVIAAGLVWTMFANGGLSGWAVSLLVNVPILAMVLLGRNAGRTAVAVGVALVVVFALATVLPDVWLVPVDPSTSSALRIASVTMLVTTTGTIATFAIGFLERTLDAARRAEHRADEAARDKTAFLSNLSHELRTPMNAILGYSDLLLEEAPAEVRDIMAQVQSAGRELLGLIDDVLEAVRLDGASPDGSSPVTLDELLDSFVRSAPDQLVNVGTREVDPQEPIAGEAEQLGRVVRQIVAGFRSRSSKSVEVEARSGSEGLVIAFAQPAGPKVDPGALPLEWLLAERLASSLGAALHPGPRGDLELVLGGTRFTPRSIRRPAPRWSFGSLDSIRSRLAVGLVTLSLVMIVISGPVTIVLNGETRLAAIATIAGWAALYGSVLALYRAQWTAVAGMLMSVGTIVALTLTQWFWGGPDDTGIVYYALLPALGILIVGSRWGGLLTALNLTGLGALVIGGQLDLITATPPDARVEIAFVAGSATAMGAAIVAIWSRPLEAAIAAAEDAAWRSGAAERAATRMLELVSAGLRTRLNTILGYTELLLEDPLEDDLEDDVAAVHEAGARLLGLVDDIIVMSAMASDRRGLQTRPIAAAPVLEAVGASLEPTARARGNDLRVRAPAELLVQADPVVLEEILEKLTTNAIKFTRDGEIVVAALEREPEVVTFIVQDTGIGIADEDLQRVFQPFRQVHGASAGQYGGTGLGLSIARHLARGMDGDIEVRSTLGQGSTFVLTLPAPPPGATLPESADG